MTPAPGRSRPLTAEDLGLAIDAVERLAGSISVRARQITVRIELIRISPAQRGAASLTGVFSRLITLARRSGMEVLVVEGVAVANSRLANILVRRYGAAITAQRTLMMSFSVE